MSSQGTISQINRFLYLSIPFGGPDAADLRLTSVTGQESISRLFSFQLELLSENNQVKFDDLVGVPVTFGIQYIDSEEIRHWHGHVSRFAQLPGEGRLARYQATVVPKLWLLTRTADCRIFQEKTIPEIIVEVLGQYGILYELRTMASYRKWEYCVQYRETAFNFLSRLMEQEGLFYWFEHTDGQHKLILADHSTAHHPCPHTHEFRYLNGTRSGDQADEELITGWRYEQELRAGKYAYSDWNFKTPQADLLVDVPSLIDQGGNQRFEIYDYPGEYDKKADGEMLVRLRIEEEECLHAAVQGEGTCRLLTAGYTFALEDHDRADQNQAYLATSVTHVAHEGAFYSGIGGPSASYSNRFTCIPKSVQFRAPRQTPLPIVQGTQTAMVVGPAGREIHCDSYGRVKVQFHWDRYGRNDDRSSCWIRAAHPWAGQGWGAVAIPRVGQEVIVDFLEGDPDRPLITGRVYNEGQMPPYSLPANDMVTGYRSRSTPGGGGYNEFSMNDTAGQEMVTVHAQHDMSTTVEHDDTQTVVSGNRTIAVRTGTHTETIKGDTAITIETGAYTLDVQANTHTHHVKGAVTENYDDVQKTTVSKDVEVASSTSHIYLDAATEIKLHTGDSMIQMLSDGTIRIHGKKIEIVGTQEVKAGVGKQTTTFDSKQVQTNGAAINSTAVGVHEISGALVKIN